MKSSKIIEYDEGNILFIIGYYLNYSFLEDFRKSNRIEIVYYVKKFIGSSMSICPYGNDKEFDIMDKIFLQWRYEIEKEI